MLRGLVLGIAKRAPVRAVATGGVGRRVALRFVAGEELDDALAVVKSTNESGATVSLDYLGENVADRAAADAATRTYLEMLDRIAAAGLDANVSVKLTQVGLDLGEQAAFDNAAAIAERAVGTGTTVTLDMEDHRYTERTIETCLRLNERFPGAVGVAVQAYLHRTRADLEALIAAGAPVRLTKGAYREPRGVALQRKRDVDAAFARLARRLIEAGSYPMIATHDDRLVRFTKRRVEEAGRARDTFEFQMLYGVRRELQRQLVEEGYRLRVYVPFGSEWYPYLTRRIAERPANVRFFLEALARG